MTASKITIRNARVIDYVRCLPLLATLYHNDIGPDFRQSFESYVTNDECAVLLALLRGEVAGILIGSYQIDIDWEGETTRIDGIIVSEKLKRKRIGRNLSIVSSS